MPTRGQIGNAIKGDAGAVLIPGAKFADICSQLRTGEIDGAAAAQALESVAESVERGDVPREESGGIGMQIPQLGDEVQALPGSRFEGNLGVYYEPGDRGRVSSEVYTDGDGDECIKITWYNSGKTNDELVQSWMSSVQITQKARPLVLGDEVQALPGSRFEGKAGVYYEAGDKGRISSKEFLDSDGDRCIKVTWYKSGRTNDEIASAWMKSFKLVTNEGVLVGDDLLDRMEEAVKDQNVLPGKPAELISGQPKSAAMGLYHYMRVKDPFAADNADSIEHEVKEFVKRLKDDAVLLGFLENAPAKHEQIEDVYGVEQIARAKEDIAYFKKVARLTEDASPLDVAATVAHETQDNLEYILYQTCSEIFVSGPNATRDAGRGPIDLSDFMEHPNVQDAELTKAHVVALRFYTTPAYKYLNSPLRSTSDFYDKEKSHPLPKTVAYISEGIKKLRASYAIKVESGQATSKLVLWRGLKNMALPEDFLKNQKGGTELAPMSTTTDLSVATKYACSGESVLLKISLDNFMQYGADLQWLSAFPGEEEVLYPPLTYLQPTTRDPQVVQLSTGHKFTVYEVKPTIP